MDTFYKGCKEIVGWNCLWYTIILKFFYLLTVYTVFAAVAEKLIFYSWTAWFLKATKQKKKKKKAYDDEKHNSFIDTKVLKGLLT